MTIGKITKKILFVILLANTVSYGTIYYKVIPGALGTNGKILISQDFSWLSNNSACTGGSTCTQIEIEYSNKFSEYLLACLNKMDNMVKDFQVVGTNYKFIFHSPGSLHQCLWELEFFKDDNGINIKITTKSGSAAGKVGTILLPKNSNFQEQLKIDYMVSLLVEAIPSYKGEESMNKILCFNTNGNGIITEMYAGSNIELKNCP